VINRILLSLVMLLTSLSAHAEIEIQITRGSDTAIPIAVVPFKWSGPGRPSDEMGQIIGNDLEFSGGFKPLPVGSMLSQPSTSAEVFYRDWKMLGQQYLVIGRYTYNPAIGQFEGVWELHDVLKQTKMDSGSAKAGAIRDLAHYAADQIYEKLTGIRGIFSTKLLYVTAETLRGKGKGKRYRLNYSDIDGYRETVLLASPEPVLSPSWSPNGSKIAYVSFQDKRPAIFIQELRTAKQVKITNFKGINGAPSWSPDGTRLAMSLSKDGNPEIYVMDVASRQLKRITSNIYLDTEPSWTPDGKSLIYTSDRTGRNSAQIYQVNLLTGEETRLTFEGSFNAKASMTKDGRFMVYVHRIPGGRDTVAVQDLVKNTISVLSNTDLDESPSVAPNGNMVIYATNSRGLGLLRVVTLNGGFTVDLPAKYADVREPAWSPFLN